MTDYERFARFYDAVMDDPAPRAVRVLDAVTRHRRGAQSLLELGCGTGAILAGLDPVPFLTGLDRSPAMLSVAAQKVPRARLLAADMADFELGERFDVVACVFDSLNHLLTFDAWRSLFDAAHRHLADGGLFIFDVNTTGELRRLAAEPPWTYDFDDDLLVLDVAVVEEGARPPDVLTRWDIRIFEHLDGDRFRLHHEQIDELGVPLDIMLAEVERRFVILDLRDDQDLSPTEDSVKAHVTCRRR